MDPLTKLYDEWKKNFPEGVTPEIFQAFQGGFTSGAVHMRQRAMDACGTDPKLNDVKNKIGSLSDIP